MDGQWKTYREIATTLGVSVEAARRRALRGKWARTLGNDGMTRVRPPDDLSPPRAPDVRPDAVPDASALVTALENHIKTLQGENDALRQQLRAEADRLAAAEARAAQEAEKVGQAIAAFASLADRLDAMAEANQRRSWWPWRRAD